MILDYNNTPALHYWHENVAAYKENWESIGEVRNSFCFAIASPRTQTYFRLSLGQPEIRVCVRRRPRLRDRLHSRHFFQTLSLVDFGNLGGEGVRLFFSLWEAERHAGFLHSNTYCCRLFLPRPLYIHTCKRFHPRDIYHHADRDQKHIHLHLRENQPRQQFAYWSKISILYNILRKYNT